MQGSISATRHSFVRAINAIQLPRALNFPLTRRLCAGFLLLGISASLILPDLGFPRGIIFDEAYYITHAQKYLNGVFYLQTHPPLGKLLIALGEKLTYPDAAANEFVNVEKVEKEWPKEVDISGYRLFPAVFGILNPLLVFAILTLILAHELYAFAMALFVALDNALILQSRSALLDSAMIFFCMASLLAFVYLARQPIQRTRMPTFAWAIFGILAACAASVKLSGLFVVVLAVAYGARLLWTKQTRRALLFALIFGGFFALTFLGVWQIHFSIGRQFNPQKDYGISDAHKRILMGVDHPDPISRFIIQFKDGMNYAINSGLNLGKVDFSNSKEIGSPWYWWLVGGRTIDYRWETPNGVVFRYSYLIGNPITWLVSLLGVIGGTALVVSDLLFRFLRAGNRQWVYSLAGLYWVYLLPLMFVERVTYLYHYLPPLIIGVMLFGIVLWQAQALTLNVKRDALVVALLLLVFSFWVFKPFTYAEPLTRAQFQQRNVFPAWDLKCAGC